MTEHESRVAVGTVDDAPDAVGDALDPAGLPEPAAPTGDLIADPGAEPAVLEAVARERGRIAADLRAVVVDALHRLSETPAEPEDREAVAAHARTALDAVHRAAALGGLPLPGGPSGPARGHALRPAGLVVGTLVGAAAVSLAALVVVLLPGSVAAGPLLVVALAVAVALTGCHAPPAASAVVLAVVLGVLALAAPCALTTASTTGAVAGTVDLPVEAAPEPGECLLLGVVLAAAYALGLHRRRHVTATGRRTLLGVLDGEARGAADGRLGLPESLHQTLTTELRALAGPDAGDPRRRRLARHRLAAVLPTLAAVDVEPGRGMPELDAVLDEGRVAVLVASARHAAQIGGAPAARHGGRPPSVVVRGVPAVGHPEVGLLAARLLGELVAEMASRSGPVAACVSVEHRADAVVLEVASGRSRVPGSRPGRLPAGLAERAALLGGTVEVTSCREAISVRVVLPPDGTLPAPASAPAAPGPLPTGPAAAA
ncbi:MAG TPA: hypothetical protein VGH76_03510 [Actinomycetospora sp.]|uniref:hypothetical protein n=1 Tax=Actinomycetospora sp. TaxID=1872135 RepID=UPI002F40EBC9